MQASVLIDQLNEIEVVINKLTEIISDPGFKDDFQMCLIEIKEDGSCKISKADKKNPNIEKPKKSQKKHVA